MGEASPLVRKFSNSLLDLGLIIKAVIWLMDLGWKKSWVLSILDLISKAYVSFLNRLSFSFFSIALIYIITPIVTDTIGISNFYSNNSDTSDNQHAETKIV